jgi:hypothetical protein
MRRERRPATVPSPGGEERRTTGREWALLACVVFAGLWSGLLAMLTLVVPADWVAGRTRYFALNWIRAAATWTAFGLFSVALIALEGV